MQFYNNASCIYILSFYKLLTYNAVTILSNSKESITLSMYLILLNTANDT